MAEKKSGLYELTKGLIKENPTLVTLLGIPIVNRERVKPSPMPKPSSMEWKTPFFEANASARPRIIQFTVISERNSPKLKENPTLVTLLGMCPTLAVTTMASNGIGMGLATTFVLRLTVFLFQGTLFPPLFPRQLLPLRELFLLLRYRDSELP